MTSMLAIASPAVFDYSAVTMECVSEHNWNQDQENTYRSASPYFVGSKGNISWAGQTSTCRGWVRCLAACPQLRPTTANPENTSSSERSPRVPIIRACAVVE
eukprot:1358178-Prymnesium_polylepis.2